MCDQKIDVLVSNKAPFKKILFFTKKSTNYLFIVLDAAVKNLSAKYWRSDL